MHVRRYRSRRVLLGAAEQVESLRARLKQNTAELNKAARDNADISTRLAQRSEQAARLQRMLNSTR